MSAFLEQKSVIRFAEILFNKILPKGFNGRLFLAGGAFKSVIHGKLPHDLDIWSVSETERLCLLNSLIQQGATIIRDNKPYQTVLDCNGYQVEVVYKSKTSLEHCLSRFDISLSAIGVEYNLGHLRTKIHPLAFESVKRKEMLLLKPIANWEYALVTLERLRRYAEELNFTIPASEEEHLWNIFKKQEPTMRQEMIEKYHQVGRYQYHILEELCHHQ